MNTENILIIDLETGGLDELTNGTCSVAMKVFDKDITDEFLIKPHINRTYTEKALEINGLNTIELEEKGITAKEACERIISFIRKNFNNAPQVLGHNVKFDLNFLKHLFLDGGYQDFNNFIDRDFLDSKVFANLLKRLGKYPNRSTALVSAYRHFTGKEPVNAHNALADVLMTEEVFNKELEIFQNKKQELTVRDYK